MELHGLGRRNCTGAHRVSWMLHRGEIPAGLLVLHECDRPSCVNPAHLFLGTHKDNTADAVAKGRMDRDCLGKLNRGVTGVAHPAARFDVGERDRAVMMYLRGGVTYEAIARATGCGRQTIGRWILEYRRTRPDIYGVL